MKYFLDTEFIEDGRTIDLLSMGIVSEDGRTLYRQNLDAQFHTAGDWVRRNVLPSLEHFDLRGIRSCEGRPNPQSMANGKLSMCHDATCPWRSRYEIRDEVKAFMDVQKFGKPEVWGYYADYDWVVFCQLFGAMVELPKGFPMYCNDLKQFAMALKDPEFPKSPTSDKHHALLDALEIKARYEWLIRGQQ